MNLRFIKEKTHSTIMLWYAAIAILCFNAALAALPYIYYDPKTSIDKFALIGVGIFIFLFMALFIVGVFVLDVSKDWEKIGEDS